MDLSLSLLHEIVEKSDNGKIVLNSKSQIVLWNKWIADQSGISSKEAKGHLLTDLFRTPLPPRLLRAIANAIKSGQNSLLSHSFTPHPLPLRHPYQSGLMYQKVIVQSLQDEPGNHYCLIEITDMSHSVSREAKLQEQSDTLQHMAKHDPLTGLPNRNLFHEYLTRVFDRAQRQHTRFAVMYMDLDKFKIVNDSLGHHVGDLLLVAISERISHLIRKSDVVSRFGGDEFVILADSLEREEEAAVIAQKILTSLSEPILIEGKTIHASISIGIATYPQAGGTPDGLIRNADVALYRAKELGRNTFQFFTSQMNSQANERILLEKELRNAIEQEEFLVYYQPQMDLASGRIVGAEALLRWHHPERGVLGPSEFLALASETGLIVPIGEWVLKKVCSQVKVWHLAGAEPLRIAVNISGQHFRRPGAVENLIQIIRQSGVDPGWIELELTEEVLIERVEENIDALWRLRDLGVHIAIDDFGTGYSSLSYLKHFPINTLKIDRSFVQQLIINERDAIITKNVIGLAHDLGLKVIAEGVETADLLPFLLDQHCDEGQGYLYSHPVPPELFWAYYQKNQPK